MRIELSAMPPGCKMAVTESTQWLHSDQEGASVQRIVGRAVCGDRQLETTRDYMATGRFTVGPNPRAEAQREVADDLSHLVGAACLGCPNLNITRETFPSNQ